MSDTQTDAIALLNAIKKNINKPDANGSADLMQYRLDRLEDRVGLLEADLKILLTDTTTIKAKLDAIPTKEDVATQLLSQQRWMMGVLITVALSAIAMIVQVVIRSISS